MWQRMEDNGNEGVNILSARGCVITPAKHPNSRDIVSASRAPPTPFWGEIHMNFVCFLMGGTSNKSVEKHIFQIWKFWKFECINNAQNMSQTYPKHTPNICFNPNIPQTWPKHLCLTQTCPKHFCCWPPVLLQILCIVKFDFFWLVRWFWWFWLVFTKKTWFGT